MADNLVVVESPAKAKTIKKYLGKDFEVLASYGHVRDLVPKEGAVDTARGFAMKYQVLEKNQRHVDSIARGLAKSKALYLATDPDREGEAIAWHLKEILESRGELDGKTVHRVVFYEITRNAVREAVAQPRNLSLDLVNAQQARRALDYLVGFNLSPLLWKKVRRGLSAGGGQSAALPAEAHRVRRQESRAVLLYQRDTGPGSRARHPGGGAAVRVVGRHRRARPAPPPARHRGRPQAAAAHAGATVHDLDHPAGGGAQARLQCPAHHARR